MHRKLLRTITVLTMAVGLGVGAVGSASAQDDGIGAGVDAGVDVSVTGAEDLLALVVGLVGSLLGGIPLPL